MERLLPICVLRYMVLSNPVAVRFQRVTVPSSSRLLTLSSDAFANSDCGGQKHPATNARALENMSRDVIGELQELVNVSWVVQ